MIDRRRMTAQVAVLGGVCVGAWLLFVAPRERDLAKVERQIAAIRSAQSPDAVAAFEAAARESQGLRVRLATIEAAGRLSRDSSALYDSITALARDTGATVERLTPASPAASPREGDAGAERMRLSIVVGGSFEDVLRFIDQVQRLATCLQPISIDLVPAPGEGGEIVTARIEVDSVSFLIPETLAGWQEAHDDDRP
jgi:hypothetical protein